MGLKCQTERKNGDITDVKAPNGNPSLLYKTARKILGSKRRAIEVWATAYTSDFIDYYGDWRNPSPTSFFNTDLNGEPIFNDVIKFMERSTYFTSSLTSKDVADVNSFFTSNLASSMRDLISRISNALLSGGNMVLNEYTLKKSGLYTQAEINRILSDISIKNQVTSALRSILDYENDYVDAGIENHYLTASPVAGPVILKDEYNQFGKQVAYNPGEIRDALEKQVGGVTDRSNFDMLVESMEEYPEFVEKYNNDLGFTDVIYDEYSVMTALPKAEIRDGEVTPASSRTLTALEDYSFYNSAYDQKWKSEVSKLLAVEDSLDQEAVTPILRNLEEIASKFGIDIIGLSSLYESSPEIYDSCEDLVLATDIHISRLAKSDTSYQSDLATAIDSILKKSDTDKAVYLPSSLEGRTLLYVEQPLSDKEMFENYSLLKVAPNIYQRIERENKEELYDFLANAAALDVHYLPASAFSSYFFKNGQLDKAKVENEQNRQRVADSIREYAISLSDSNNTEEMILTRLAFRDNPVLPREEISVDREYNKYIQRDNKIPSENIPRRLYAEYLSNKLNNTELYDSVYKYLDFKPGQNIGLTVSDPHTLKMIDLNSEGRLRSDLMAISLSSTDPTISDLFYAPSRGVYRGSDFYHYLYTSHPELLSESKAEITIRDGYVIAEGEYSDFIKVNNEVMMKTGESAEGSVYQNLRGTEVEVKEASTQVSKPSMTENSNVLISQNISLVMKLTKTEGNRLDILECH